MQTKLFKFRLVSIDELKFSFSSDEALDEDRQIAQSFGIATAIRYDWNTDQNIIGIVIDNKYQRQDNQKDVLQFECRINFVVEDLESFVDIRDPQNDFDMDESLETTLVSISISTIRGMLFERTRGTVFHKHLLPLMDPKKLLVSKLLKQQQSSDTE